MITVMILTLMWKLKVPVNFFLGSQGQPAQHCVSRLVALHRGRLFSQGGNIFTEKRTGLGAEKLDDLLFVMWNRDLESASSIAL